MRQSQWNEAAGIGELVFECDHLSRFQPVQCFLDKSGSCWCPTKLLKPMSHRQPVSRNAARTDAVAFNCVILILTCKFFCFLRVAGQKDLVFILPSLRAIQGGDGETGQGATAGRHHPAQLRPTRRLYKPVQCDPLTGYCLCVDQSGFELAGTQARSLNLANCTSKALLSFSFTFLPKITLIYLCWTCVPNGMLGMLCLYEFELDSEGFPLCQCCDPCKAVKCPGSQTCRLEERLCAKEPCPPIPNNKFVGPSSARFILI